MYYSGYWHFDNGAKSKIDDALTEHGGLLHVLPLAVHRVVGVGWVVSGPMILVSGPVPLGLIWFLNWVGLGGGWV